MGRSAEEMNLSDDGDDNLDDDDTTGLDRGDSLDQDDDDEGLDPDDLEELAGEGSRFVPHARFNEVNEQLKAERTAREELERRMAALEGRPPKEEPAPPPAFDFEEKEEAYMEALMEGDTAKAKEIRKEIRSAERQQLEAEMEYRVTTKLSQQEATRLFMEEAESAIEKYPFLADGQNQNAEAVKDVKEWRDFYIAKGEPAHKALRMAAAKVGPMYAGDGEGQPSKPTGLAAIRQSRQAEARLRNARANITQPPTVKGGMGERGRSRNLTVADLSEKEFDDLSPKEKAELRGDKV